MRLAITIKTLRAAIMIGLSVSIKNAIEIVARNTPKYKLALLRAKPANSSNIAFEYLTTKIKRKEKAKKPVIIV
jgi:hypothetical protein